MFLNYKENKYMRANMKSVCRHFKSTAVIPITSDMVEKALLTESFMMDKPR